jgi:hypothetical protein
VSLPRKRDLTRVKGKPNSCGGKSNRRPPAPITIQSVEQASRLTEELSGKCELLFPVASSGAAGDRTPLAVHPCFITCHSANRTKQLFSSISHSSDAWIEAREALLPLPNYLVPYARSPASPRPGTMNARSSRDSSIAAVQIGTSGWAPRIRSMP